MSIVSKFCALFIVGCISCVAANAEPVKVADGIILQYKDFSARDKSDQEGLLQKLSIKPTYRSRSYPTDVLLPKKSEDRSNPKFLGELCARLLKNSLARSCETNFIGTLDVNEKNQNSCDSGGKKPICELPDLSPVLEKLSCYPYQRELSTGVHSKVDLKPALDGLPPLWAQELIGADLASNFMDTLPSKRDVPVVVFDQGNDHSQRVISLLSGNTAIAVGKHAHIVKEYVTGHNSDFLEGVDDLEKLKPELANHSMGFRHEEGPFQEYSPLASPRKDFAKKTILVESAGNDHPFKGLDPLKRNLADSIKVGSMSPLGFPAESSVEGKEVTLLAPADAYIMSAIDSKPTVFAGTSAAAPLVTGSLSNFLSIFPKLDSPLTSEEAKLVLKNTAVPLVTSNLKPQLHGAGMLNAYKLVRVAARLKDSNWHTIPTVERLSRLQDPELYNFDKEINEKANLARDLLTTHQDQLSCDQLRKALFLLREAFLLDRNSNHSTLQKDLATLHRSLGLEYSAKFFQSLVSEQEAKKIISEPKPFYGSANRVRELLGTEVSEKLLQDNKLFLSDGLLLARLGHKEKLLEVINLRKPTNMSDLYRILTYITESEDNTLIHGFAQYVKSNLDKYSIQFLREHMSFFGTPEQKKLFYQLLSQ